MAEKLRITFVLPFAGLAGGIRVIAIYADSLQKRGHDVLVVSLPRQVPSVTRRLRGWVRGRPVKCAPNECPSYFDGLTVKHRVLERHRPVTNEDIPDGDVVIATWWRTAPWVAEFSPLKGAKAYFVQDYGAHEGQPLDKVAETWRLPLHKMTISKWLLSLVIEHSGDEDVAYVPNAVDCNQFYAPSRGKQIRPTVGLMYSRRPQKGLGLMLEAIELARRKVADLHVVAYGPDDPRDDLQLPPSSEFTKLAAEDMLRGIYAKCDAWLFGSRLEGFGLPILEAMACRTPVVATPAGAAPELLEGGGGVIVGQGDPQDMARSIETVCGLSEAQWRRMSDAAYKTATGYTWEDATDQFEAGLRAAIERHHRTSAAGATYA
ncbi:MAG: glycosyltransferase family 4 protein [Phycisphaerales bacterium]|nr:MAG: glycosyltransferase family 4 protein [Phycisphaerales bacterium]